MRTSSIFVCLLVGGCGTSSSVTQTPVGDAGCGDAGEILDAGGSISTPDAGASLCPAGACNYQDQTGCAGGQACRPQFSSTSTVVAAGCEPAGSGKSDATCQSSADCAVGFYCAAGACHRQCCGGDWSVCDPGESCFRSVLADAGGKVTSTGMELCFPVTDCDPLASGSCPSGQSCALVDSAGRTACITASPAQAGSDCDLSHSCAGGSVCVDDASGAAHCRALCRAAACGETSCAAGQGVCVHFARDPAGVGECTPE